MRRHEVLSLLSMTRLLRHSTWLAPLIVFVGAVSYFLVFVRYPALRDFPWVNLPLVVLGAGWAILGLARGWKDARWRWRIFSLGGALFSVFVAGLFAFYVFVLSGQMPAAATVAEKLVAGTVAPDFSLPDANGNPVSLGDQRGQRVVLVFYRGFW